MGTLPVRCVRRVATMRSNDASRPQRRKAATHRERLHIKHKNEPSVATFDLLRIEPTQRYVIYVSQCPRLSRLVCTFNLLTARFYDKFFLTL